MNTTFFALRFAVLTLVIAGFLGTNIAAKADEYGIATGPESVARLYGAARQYQKQITISSPNSVCNVFPQSQSVQQIAMARTVASTALASR